MMAIPPGLCGECNYFVAGEYSDVSVDWGGCHRYPPRIEFIPRAVTPEMQVTARFPNVKPTDWCGDFKMGGP